MATRICTDCGRELPFSEFRSQKSGKYGLHSKCLECGRARAREYMRERRRSNPDAVKEAKRLHQEKNKDKYKQYKRLRYLENREEILEKARLYREQNRETIRQRDKMYRLASPEKYRQKDRKNYRENREKISERARSYRKTNRIRINQQNRLRKQNLRQVTIDFTSKDWDYALNYFENRCAACGRPQGLWHTIAADHWIPLSRGGQSIRANIVPLCHGLDGCNNSKRNRDAFEWAADKFGERRAIEIVEMVDLFFASLEEH